MSDLTAPAGHRDGDSTAASLAAYLANVVDGKSMSEIARIEGVPTSTVSRRIACVESWREVPEWDEIITRMETARGRMQTPAPLRPDGEGVARACGTTLAEAAADLRKVLGRIAAGAVMATTANADMAAVLDLASGEKCGTGRRASVLVGLAVGWLKIAKSGRVTKIGLGPAYREAFGVPAPATSARIPSPTPMRAAAPLPRWASGSAFEAWLRKAGMSETDIRMAWQVVELFDLHRASPQPAVASILRRLPPSLFRLLSAVLGSSVSIEAVEAEMGLPARSAKALLRVALEAIDHSGGLHA